jgi:hypothetical protein
VRNSRPIVGYREIASMMRVLALIVIG